MNHTPGKWKSGIPEDAIISDCEPEQVGLNSSDESTRAGLSYYGGIVVCESMNKRDRALIMAAPDLLESVRALMYYFHPAGQTLEPEGPQLDKDKVFEFAIATIAKALGRK